MLTTYYQEHYFGVGILLGHIPEDCRLGDEYAGSNQGDWGLPHQDRDQAQGYGGEDEDTFQRIVGLPGVALGREDGGVAKGEQPHLLILPLSCFLSPKL